MKGEIPTHAWLLVAGTIHIKDDHDKDGTDHTSTTEYTTDNTDEYIGEYMTDLDSAAVLESEVCLQMETYKSYMYVPNISVPFFLYF